MQRLFRIHSPGGAFFDRLVGARSCAANPARCQLASGVIADDSTRTLTFRPTAPDPDFLFKLALGFIVPVPPATPMHDIGTHPIPGTGPYRFASIGAHRIVFVRNRRFREWSHAAQPDGQPDRIEWRFGATPEQEDAAVEGGRPDWTGDLPSDLGSVVRQYASQVHSNVWVPRTPFEVYLLEPSTVFLGIPTRAKQFPRSVRLCGFTRARETIGSRRILARHGSAGHVSSVDSRGAECERPATRPWVAFDRWRRLNGRRLSPRGKHPVAAPTRRWRGTRGAGRRGGHGV
jgi:Bacterial extracellular solute-binding proteins, family 5 Middle